MAFDPHADDSRLRETHDPHDRQLRRREGTALTAVLLVLLVVCGAVLFVILLVELTGIAACSGNLGSCDFTLLGVTTWIIPSVVGVFIVLTLLSLVTGRKSSRSRWWIPVLGIVTSLVAFVIASALVSLAIHV
ncbi:DUF1129 family protein [Rathayibacter toxicus]|uniref:Uncharacterized protein n=1 Tax=Rathayibacter toxicus TaxID=145458 RepID=A0A0C5BFJ4_9MICO|nr:DUF1129 family protein [Rathayibacter toxicus]AJM78106.1 hypothetical protein TI83_09505 [Rathayibacter toxicus]ALS57640.1 hypothetical protein APU90_07560 [Rathayibacter toxicus]KKM44990.1 hypothetical protein VT73_07725 [Rathayibacter toxicus]PPG20689.1 hypothetical protein C5D15_09365 [Rathayibacter toxicus]PPG45793.1 hypothetical protein C5D16_09330 [Rathayibacter toxicus]